MVLQMTMIMRLFLISSCCILLEGRLVEKSAEKVTSTPEPDLVKSTLYHRVARNAADGNMDISNEMEIPDENLKDYYKPVRNVIKNLALARFARGSDQQSADIEKLNESLAEPTTEKRILIKKPIPKFYEGDSENEFQKLADSVNLKLVDSGNDNEDEDFNVGDYDFDVNHDEYAGRDRHLEPRLKKIENKFISELHKQEEVKSVVVLIPTPIVPEIVATPKSHKQNVKREYPFLNTYKPNVKRDDEYSDEASTTPATATFSEKESKIYDEDSYDDSIKEGNKPGNRSPSRM